MIKNPGNILVYQRPECQSANALRFALKIAERSPESQIHVVDVQPMLTEFWDELLDKQFNKRQTQIRANQLRELVEPFEGSHANIKCQILSGRPVVKLTGYCQENSIDLIVKVGGGDSNRSIYSSLDHRIVRQCPANVTILSAAEPDASTPDDDRSPVVFVAINPVDDAREFNMNCRLLRAASLIAEAFALDVKVVAAVKPPGIIFAHNEGAREESLRLEKLAIDKGSQCLDRMITTCNLPTKLSTVVEYQSPDELILEKVNRIRPVFLVMGSVVRSWMRGLLIGSVTDRVAHSLPCSLLVIRPDEAISTVANSLNPPGID